MGRMSVCLGIHMYFSYVYVVRHEPAGGYICNCLPVVYNAQGARGALCWWRPALALWLMVAVMVEVVVVSRFGGCAAWRANIY
jgi:hypothetical protein